MNTTLVLTGIGLRPPHYKDLLEKKPSVAWVEVHSENFFVEGGKQIHLLEQARRDYPISLHGVGLSLGSYDELNWHHLKKLKDLALRIKPCLISEHLSWSSSEGHYLHDLLPLPYTMEVVDHLVNRIQQVQDFLQQQIIIENISSYVQFKSSLLSEAEFLVAIAERSGCGILLDVNNIYVSAHNLNFNPESYIRSIPAALVQEIHLAGFTSTSIDGVEVLIDTHNRAVLPAVWDLYRYAIQTLGRKPTIIEWDSDLPSLDTLCLEAYRAEKIIRETHVTTKYAS